MVLFLKDHTFAYELENVARVFFRDIRVVQGAVEDDRGEDFAFCGVALTRGLVRLRADVSCDGKFLRKEVDLPAGADNALYEITLAGMLFDLLCITVKTPPPWGILTGVRPAKLAGKLLEQGMTVPEATWRLCADYRVDEAKARLALRTAQNGAALIKDRCDARSYSLYVSIPFCPTRCSYCSFVSKTVGRDITLLDRYVDAVCEEIAVTGAIAEELGLRLATVYVGGGTPTTLSALQLETLCGAITKHVSLTPEIEFTVEAGRPDTITPEKLAVLRHAGVNRISVNPQTANDAVLQRVGRHHTKAETEAAFAMVRAAGFPVVNADLIAGLPGDGIVSFGETMSWLLALSPENITVHALTRKRSSDLKESGGEASRDAAKMVDLAAERLEASGYAPYYMYRQKGTVDALENTGYAKPGTGCLYNLYMMEELHTILSCGGGAVTKLVHPYAGKIERITNYKYPAEYIAGFSQLIERKERIRKFYESIV